MKIESIDLYRLELPLKQTYGPLFNPQTCLYSIFARVGVDGQYGWGEVSLEQTPRTSQDWAGGAYYAASELLAPAWIGQKFDLPTDLPKYWDSLRGCESGKAVLETALLDACARIKGKPLYEFLAAPVPGGYEAPGSESKSDPVPPQTVYYPFDQIADFEQYCKSIEKAIADGFRFLEIKCRPGWDIMMLNAIRDLTISCRFHVDFCGALGEEHQDILYRCEDFFPLFLQQPFDGDDLVLSAMVQESFHTPFGLTEGINSARSLEIAADMNAARVFGVNSSLLGGLLKAKELLGKIRELGATAHNWSRLTTGLGARSLQTQSALAKNTIGQLSVCYPDTIALDESGSGVPLTQYPIPYWKESDWFVEPLFDDQPTVEFQKAAAVELGTAPGLGVDVDEKRLEPFVVEHATFE